MIASTALGNAVEFLYAGGEVKWTGDLMNIPSGYICYLYVGLDSEDVANFPA